MYSRYKYLAVYDFVDIFSHSVSCLCTFSMMCFTANIFFFFSFDEILFHFSFVASALGVISETGHIGASQRLVGELIPGSWRGWRLPLCGYRDPLARSEPLSSSLVAMVTMGQFCLF